jgi:hypothetical protein
MKTPIATAVKGSSQDEKPNAMQSAAALPAARSARRLLARGRPAKWWPIIKAGNIKAEVER